MAEVLQKGESTCPICGNTWLVTPNQDCFIPACGCFGDVDANPELLEASNPNRPCWSCGYNHATRCEKKKK